MNAVGIVGVASLFIAALWSAIVRWSTRNEIDQLRHHHSRDLIRSLDVEEARCTAAERARCLAIARYHGARVVAEGIEAGRIAGERPRRARVKTLHVVDGPEKFSDEAAGFTTRHEPLTTGLRALIEEGRITLPDEDQTERTRVELAEFATIPPAGTIEVKHYIEGVRADRHEQLRPPAGDMAVHIDDDPTPEPAA